MKNEAYERKWYVIRTRPRYEKKVFEQISCKGIEAFLPLIVTIRKWSDRKKKISIPMFPGYIFVFADERERAEAIQDTVGAIKYVFYRGEPAIVSEKEVNSIKISLNSPDRVKVENTNVSKGDIVKITGGTFTGLEGVVTELRGKFKITVNITELSMSLSIVLHPDEVKLLQKIND